MTVVVQNMNKSIAIIAIHGWQGDKTSLQPLTKSIGEKNIKWFLPQGPYSAEEKGYSWYGGSIDTKWEMDLSFDLMNRVVAKASDQFSNEDVYFLGFSQGAVFAFHYIVQRTDTFGGAIPIAGFVPYKRQFETKDFTQKNDTPFLILHGAEDTIVKPEGSQEMHSILSKAGFNSNLITYKGGHKIRLSTINQIKSFIFKNI